MSLVFDTLKLSKALGRAFTPEQAEVLTEALTLSTTEGLATKSDLAALRSEMKTEFAEFRTEMKTDFAEFRTEVKGDIAASRAETIRWVVGALAFNLVGTAGLMFTIAKVVAQK